MTVCRQRPRRGESRRAKQPCPAGQGAAGRDAAVRERRFAALCAAAALCLLWAALAASAALWQSRAAQPGARNPRPFAPKAPAARTVDFAALRAVNPDIVGWIHGAQLGIDEPVVQAVDNARYLSTGFDGGEDARGTVFLDCACADGFWGQNVVLYGHRLRAGGRFSALARLRDPAEFARLCDDLALYTPAGDIPLRIVAVGCGPAQAARRQTAFGSQRDFQAQVAAWLADCSLGEAPHSAPERLYTLITCDYSGPNYRLYVYAVAREAKA